MNRWAVLLTLSVLVLPCLVVADGVTPDYMPGKKLICFGWGTHWPQTVLENLEQTEGYGFDGICFQRLLASESF